MNNENRIVESTHTTPAVDHRVITVFVLFGLSVVCFLLVALSALTSPHVAFIALFVILGIAGASWYGKQAHLHALHHVDRRHQHKDVEHRRDTVTLALSQGCSVQVKYADGSEMNLIHPTAALAANASNTTIKELNYGQQQLAAPGAQYPIAPPFASMKSLIRPGSFPLGYLTAGPAMGDISDLLSMAFVGKPGTGKSTALLYYLAALLMMDARVFTLDPQGSLSDLSGLIPYYGEFSEIYGVLPEIHQEIAEREDLYRRKNKQVRNPLLLLVDEVPAIARYEERMKPSVSVLDLAEKITTENRKHNCFCILTGTSLPANILPTLTRDNLSSRIVFNSSDMHARMAGLDADSRKLLLPLLRKASPGTAILDVSRRPQPDIAALPFTTIDDLRMIVDAGSDDEESSSIPVAFPGAWEASPEDFTDVGSGGGGGAPAISSEERERIIDLRQSGIPRRKLPLAMGKGNRYYDVVKEVLDEEGIE